MTPFANESTEETAKENGTENVKLTMAQPLTTTSTTSATPKSDKKKAPGLTFKRFFTKAGVSPYDEVEWELRTALITDAQGAPIFEQKNVEVPKDWSMTATNIVASKYLHGKIGTPERETGVRQLITRVVESIRDWGLASGYFRTAEDATVFHDELAHILIQQKAAFNSPVWFNVGCDRLEPESDAQNWHWNPELRRVEFARTGYRYPQCSACFINSVQDSLDSILTLAKTEGMLIKWGSGTGTNLSTLRSSNEGLSGGGTASGPLSFMKGFDAFAGVIKRGGNAATLDDAGKGVESLHEAQRPASGSPAAQAFIRAAQRGKIGARPRAPLEQHAFCLGQGKDGIERILHRIDEARRALRIAVARPPKFHPAQLRIPMPVLRV